MKREEIRRTGGKKRGFDGTIDNQRWLIKESGLSWCILSLSVLVVKRRGTWKYVLFSRRGVWKLCRKKTVIGERFSVEFPASFDVDIPPSIWIPKEKEKLNWKLWKYLNDFPSLPTYPIWGCTHCDFPSLPPNISNMRVYTLWAVSSAWDEMNHNTWLLWQVHGGRFG